MDPYCVYDTIQGACVGINSANQNAALQNITDGVANCPVGKKFTICYAVTYTISCYRIVIIFIFMENVHNGKSAYQANVVVTTPGMF